mgnify:CR=1 FL=1
MGSVCSEAEACSELAAAGVAELAEPMALMLLTVLRALVASIASARAGGTAACGGGVRRRVGRDQLQIIARKCLLVASGMRE